MWEKIKQLSEHRAVKLLKTICGDPVQLYAVFLVMTVMYYYHQDFAWVYTLLCVLLSFVLMKFYDFVANKGLIGSISYLVYLFAGLYAVGMIANLGQQSYPISFGVWFLTPQSVVDFSMAYTIGIYILMTGFLTSAVYYFAKVRYRMTMQFLIMLIPLSLYAKENLQMPALLVILLLSSYFLLMVYCRQLRESDTVRHISSLQGGISIAAYVTAFSILAAIVPKPAIEADREFIDNAMSYSTWSDVLMSAISMFTESTDNSYSTFSNGRTLFSAYSDEALRLRTQTYSYYAKDDSWTVLDYDRMTEDYAAPLTYKPQELLQAIVDAAGQNAEFAKTYGLEDIVGQTLPEQVERSFFIFSWYNSTVLPSPTRTRAVTEGMPESLMKLSSHQTVALPFSSRGVTLTYYPDVYAQFEEVQNVLQHLNHETYTELLLTGAGILQDSDPEASALLMEVFSEAMDAEQLLETTAAMDYQSDAVDELARELTEGLSSDIEKARAIEQYFAENGFLYDSSYQKNQGVENVDDFLQSTRRGVCYEFATAMTLLCRSAGLPARYVQGYNMGERYNSTTRSFYNMGNYRETNFVIKVRDAHAFPEVYISGYGWLSFEPTIADLASDGTAENQIVRLWGYVLLVLLGIAVLIWFLLPRIRERIFRRSITRMAASPCASAVFRHMRDELHLSGSVTVRELQEQSAPFFPETALFAMMDTLLYQPASQAEGSAQAISAAYLQWQAARTAFEKEQRRQRRYRKEKVETNVIQKT